MASIYAVASGVTTGIFESWEECEYATAGVRGSRFKSFPISEREEAEKWLKRQQTHLNAIRRRKGNSRAWARKNGCSRPCATLGDRIFTSLTENETERVDEAANYTCGLSSTPPTQTILGADASLQATLPEENNGTGKDPQPASSRSTTVFDRPILSSPDNNFASSYDRHATTH
ncbi:hypothetical protein O1611_g3682 [Lasiodiplodia mahajangana]|uniref:Uncharacterized protein n=1 Tax=Lasiodiplodia mahajangana TaxID=1108764 RepID=A0ACC2JR16_9PEZI|nr:hypothetical protein O1611_g3682 [Lasiodiplodia mahajangana]